MKRKIRIKLILILLLPLGMLLAYAGSLYPETVERLYSRGVYYAVGRFLSLISGILSFSLAEIIVVLMAILSLILLFHTVRLIFKHPSGWLERLGGGLLNLLAAVSVIYFAFLLLWGLNYQRMPLSYSANLDVRPASVKELYDVCQDIISRANDVRTRVEEDQSGNMYIPGGFKSVSFRAYMGYDKLSGTYPFLGSTFGKPKGILLSEAMCYTGITGVYFPFTGEANVNTRQTDSMLPSTACHEMAHQRGFAREDEANFISYVACTNHPDADFQYSGLLLALIHSMNALYSYDEAAYRSLTNKYGPGLKRDIIQNNRFWEKYEGPVEEISDRINDAYLKSNRQEDGVYSYGRMVDLIIAQYRQKSAR